MGPSPVALVIDDDEDTVALLQTVLTRAGFQVVTATSGPDGLTLALRHRPVLATIDVTMPEMDGLEVTRRLREATDTYIVLISSLSQEHDVLAGFDAGADDYIPKPVRPRELQARLAAVARRPLSSVTQAEPGAAWAPAAVDPARGAFLHLVGEPEEPDGQDGPEGMRELGMRFVGSWIEFERLRINPSRALVVVDDRLVNALPEQVELIEAVLSCGSATVSSRQLALRVRGETEATATRTADQDREWFDSELDDLLTLLGEDPVRPRWFRVRNGHLRLVEPRRKRPRSGHDAPAEDDAGRP